MKRSDFNELVVKAAQKKYVQPGGLGCIELTVGQSKFVMTCYHDGFDWRFETERSLYDIRVVDDWMKIAYPFVVPVWLYVDDGFVIESDGQTQILFTGRSYGFVQFTLEDTE